MFDIKVVDYYFRDIMWWGATCDKYPGLEGYGETEKEARQDLISQILTL